MGGSVGPDPKERKASPIVPEESREQSLMLVA
jgi:hypothetical protein